MHFIVALSHDGCLVGGRADVMVQVCQSNKKWNDGFGIWIHPPREVGSYGERQTLEEDSASQPRNYCCERLSLENIDR